MSGYLILLIVLALFTVPFILSGFIARRVRMPEYGWKIGLILFTLSAAGLVTWAGWPPKLGIDLSGGVVLVYEVDPSKLAEDRTFKMDDLVAAVALRVNPSSVEEIVIRAQGDNQVEIQIPDVDAEEAKRIEKDISSTGALEFRILANDYDNKKLIEQARRETGDKVYMAGELKGRWVPVKIENEEGFEGLPRCASRPATLDGEKVVEFLVAVDEWNVTGDYLADASPGFDDKTARPCVDFRFNSEGARRFKELTGRNLPTGAFHRKLAIILNDSLQSVANIITTIGSKGQITGQFTKKEVEGYVRVLNQGSLPVALSKDPVSRMRSGPSLGRDTIEKAKYAITVSMILVLVFMIVYYRFAGLIACGALLANLLLILGIMITVKAAFTLTGLAGLVLTIGMAVDANVLIFERIREELSRGAALRMAIRNGFDRATTTIVDANVTTLITGLVLFTIGTEQIKGFAVVIILGVTLSMYTAIFCSRVVFDIGERRRWIKKLTMMRIVGKTTINFVGYRHLAAMLSSVIIIAGMVGVYARGSALLGIDFTGGVSIQVLFDKEQKDEFVRAEAQKQWPHVAVRNSQLEGEKPGLRFTLDIMVEKDINVVEKKLREMFLGKLSRNSVTVGKAQAVKGGSEKTGKVEDNRPATGDQTRGDLPSGLLLAAADDSMVLLAQADPPVAEPPAETPDETSVAEPPVDPSTPPPVEPAADTATPAADLPAADSPENWTEVTLTFAHSVSHDTLEEMVKEQFALQGKGVVPRFEIGNDEYSKGESKAYGTWTIKMLKEPEVVEKAAQEMAARVADTPFFPASNTIGAQVASRTQQRAILALVASLVCIVGYIWIRFQRVMFGLAAVVALVHDVLITLGAIALSAYLAPYLGFLKVEEFKIGLTTLAAFLMIIGYSLNDTIVVFDRIREVRGKSPQLSGDMVNISINQTLSRTLLTSLTTLVVVVILYFFGGHGVHGFAFALVVGVVVGTYSSVFVASPVLLWMGRSKKAGNN